MTVNTVSPAIISRAEFNLNAGQTKTPQLVRMDFTNLVSNGGFDTDIVGWSDLSTGDAAVTWNAGGYADLIIPTSGVSQISTPTTTVIGKLYNLTAEVVGNISWGVGSTAGSSNVFSTTAANGVYTFSFTAVNTTSHISFSHSGVGSTRTVDNVTLYEADPSDDAPWLRLPYGYSVGRTGMIVRDGVILHPSDYTEVKDSGQTWIKPIVAPGVSTEFSIWGSTA